MTDYATRTSTTTRFESQLFMDFPTIADAFRAGRLNASFFIAPLAMRLEESGVPCKIVYLGHRDGSTLIVRKNDPARSLRDLEGKTLAVPSFASNQYLVLREAMDAQGVPPNSIRFVEMAPPDMPAALAAQGIDAYFVGEPMAAKAELNGTGRVLYYASQLSPNFISCVLVVSDRLIRANPDEVRELVSRIAASGLWCQTHRVQAAEVAASYMHQPEKLLQYVLTTPPDRVVYKDLAPTYGELRRIEKEAYTLGVLKKLLPIQDLVDLQFLPRHVAPADISMAR